MSKTTEEYPPYACKCCGVANGDMFWDYIQHEAKNLSYAEAVALADGFDEYRHRWNTNQMKIIEAVKLPTKRKPYTKRSPYWEQVTHPNNK